MSREARDGVLHGAVDRLRRRDRRRGRRQAEDVLDRRRREHARAVQRLDLDGQIARRQPDRPEQEGAPPARQAKHAHGVPVGEHA